MTDVMYDVNVNSVRCLPAINSGSSSKFGLYIIPPPAAISSLFGSMGGGELATTWAVPRWAAWSYEKHLQIMVYEYLHITATYNFSNNTFVPNLIILLI